MNESIRLLTAEQVAEKLQVHVKWVYANRELPRVEIGGHVRWVESQVDQFLLGRISRKSAPKKKVIRHRIQPADLSGKTRKDMEQTG